MNSDIIVERMFIVELRGPKLARAHAQHGWRDAILGPEYCIFIIHYGREYLLSSIGTLYLLLHLRKSRGKILAYSLLNLFYGLYNVGRAHDKYTKIPS